MKYNFKKKIRAVFAVAFAAVTLFLMPVSALDWNGTTGGGNNGGGVASNGGYAVSTANEAAGYRFSIVDYYGNTVQGITTTDILSSSYSRYSDAYNASKFTNKYNKMQLKALKNTGSFNTSGTKANVYKDSDLGISLPTNTANVRVSEK